MINKRRYYSCICIISLFVFGSLSCKKILEQEPKNSTYLETFWKSARDCQFALAGNYALLRNALTDKANRYYMYGDAVAKSYFTIDYNGDGLEGIQNGDFTFQYNVQSLGNWTLFYKVITMSNTILKQVPSISDEALAKEVDDPVTYRNRVLGQALFLRAFTYFEMTRVWGDVPLVVEAYDDPLRAPQLPRSKKEDVWKQIEEDCHAAAALLDWGYTSTSEVAVTANKGSVYALLAHLYMWRGTVANVASSTPNMTDINSADTTISTLIAKGGYRLTDTTNYTQTFIGRSPESIFELYMSEDTQEGSYGHIGLQFLRGKQYVDYFGDNARFWVPSSYFSTHYDFWSYSDDQGWQIVTDTMDLRYRKNFDYVFQTKPMCRKYANVTYRNPGQKLDAYLSNNMIIFRLSDMMLLQAEIALYKNDLHKAVSIINFFRDRNGSNPSNRVDDSYSRDDLMWEYMAERGKEMYLEGHLYFDLIRTRKYPDFIPWLSQTRFVKEGFYWPVDPALFRDNKFLTQTPYWLGKI